MQAVQYIKNKETTSLDLNMDKVLNTFHPSSNNRTTKPGSDSICCAYPAMLTLGGDI